MDQLPLLTASRLRTARQCQRKHRYRYVDGYAPTEDVGPLRFGTMFDRAIEAWWRGRDDERLHDAIQMIPLEADPYESAMARALLTGYDARWGGEKLTVISVQGEFRIPLINPETGAASRSWQLGGKWDAIVLDERNVTLLVEGKTTSEDIAPGSDYWKRLRLDGQISIYFQGARAVGHDVQECLYDVVRKPAHRPLKATPIEDRKYTKDGALYKNQRDADELPGDYFLRLCEAIAEDPSRYYARGTVVRLDAEMEEAAFDVWMTSQQLRAAMTANRFPRNVDSCITFGRNCPFLPVCCGEARLDDTLLYRKLETIHPELTQVGS